MSVPAKTCVEYRNTVLFEGWRGVIIGWPQPVCPYRGECPFQARLGSTQSGNGEVYQNDMVWTAVASRKALFVSQSPWQWSWTFRTYKMCPMLIAGATGHRGSDHWTGTEPPQVSDTNINFFAAKERWERGMVVACNKGPSLELNPGCCGKDLAHDELVRLLVNLGF